MAAKVSGRSSVEHDEDVMKRMRATPRTPIKMTSYRCDSDGNSTQRRRGLFQASSPASSESSGGLGHMSPLTSSLESLCDSISSPHFSPNGIYAAETPVKTRSAALKEFSVRSSLFPALTKTPKLRRSGRFSPGTKGSPSIRQSVAAMANFLSDNESNETTPRSSRRFVAETITSPSSVGTPPSQRKPQIPTEKLIPTVIPPTPSTVVPYQPQSVSPEDFYGPKPISTSSFYALNSKPLKSFLASAAPRGNLLIDTIGKRGRQTRRDSVASSFSNITVASKRPRSTSGSTSRSAKRRKAVIPGVWHAIKKPKRMNKNVPKVKPAQSPNTRLQKLMAEPVSNAKQPQRLFEEKPRKRVAGKKNEKHLEDAICDTFPPPLIKRKKLPTTPIKEPEPDLSKKFMKHGSYRKAVFKINNMSVEFANGKVNVKSPEHRQRPRAKKVYKPQLDLVDFNVPEPETTDIQSHVDQILQQLTDGDPVPVARPTQLIEKISDEQLLDILESPSTKVKLVDASPTKIMTQVQSSPQRSLLKNMSGLQLSDGCDNLPLNGLLVSTSNVLNQSDHSHSANDQENSGAQKFFPVFDPSTWKSTTVLTDISNSTRQNRKRKVLVADDQYMLDAGQESVGIVKCKECGVMYQAGDFLDELAHTNFHNHLTELVFNGWKEERVVSRFKDGRIVMVNANDPKPWLEKAKKVVGVVDIELGFSENSLKWATDKQVLMFICEKTKQVVGCLVAERCAQGYRMYPTVEGVEIDTCSRDPSPCKVGVSRIWSAGHRRRQGIATRLFRALCRLAGDVATDDVAFSIPSPDGKMLARSLMGRHDFKVYGFINA